jgi:hypothetical protein
VEEDLLLATVLDARRPPREGAKHHRVFQPFALVDRYQLDGFLIGLEAQLVFLGHLALRLTLLANPFQQASDPQAVLDADAVEHLREMQQVGQAALAIGEG